VATHLAAYSMGIILYPAWISLSKGFAAFSRNALIQSVAPFILPTMIDSILPGTSPGLRSVTFDGKAMMHRLCT